VDIIVEEPLPAIGLLVHGGQVDPGQRGPASQGVADGGEVAEADASTP
jgi:hypothetical protein